MTKLQKRFLRSRICFLCEVRLDQDVCMATALGADRCSKEMMERRRQEALKTYKPRRKKVEQNLPT